MLKSQFFLVKIMENLYLSGDAAKRLARATLEQLAYRLIDKEMWDITPEEINNIGLREAGFYDFFISLQKSKRLDGSLLLEKHKKIGDLPEKYIQFIELRNSNPEVKIVVIPRGVITCSKLEEDILRNKKKTVEDTLKGGIGKINKKYAPAVTHGKHGNQSYQSRVAYHEMLRDSEIVDVLRAYSDKEEYFGFLRVDYRRLLPRDNKPGWWTPRPTLLIESLPVIIIPGLNHEHFHMLEMKEKKSLGLFP